MLLKTKPVLRRGERVQSVMPVHNVEEEHNANLKKADVDTPLIGWAQLQQTNRVRIATITQASSST